MAKLLNAVTVCFIVLSNTQDEFIVEQPGAVRASSEVGTKGYRCDPKNITLLVLDNEIYISWDTEFYDPSGCSFLVTVLNCSQPHIRMNCTVSDPNRHVRRLSLNQCLQHAHPYHKNAHPYHNDAIIIYIQWNNGDCIKGNNECSTRIYIPKVTDTVVIHGDTEGLIANLSNPYCNTNLMDKTTTSLYLCFESTPSQDFDGCYKPTNLSEHENFYLNISVDNTWLGVKGINPSLNGTVISIFCITNSCPKNIGKDYTETNIFNFEFIINAIDCDNCSSNATCPEGVCVCNPGYSGDGMICIPDAACDNITCSPHATCKEGQCMCKEGFTGDGITCDMICENCSQNVSCEEGECVCEQGYSGDGMTCDVICEKSSQHATCKEGKCVCKSGYTGDGMTSDDSNGKTNIWLYIGIGFGIGVSILIVISHAVCGALVCACMKKKLGYCKGSETSSQAAPDQDKTSSQEESKKGAPSQNS